MPSLSSDNNVQILVTSKADVSGIDQAKSKLATLDQANKASSAIMGELGAAGKQAALVTAGAFGAITAAAIDVVHSQMESQNVQAQLNAVLKSTHSAAGLTIQDLNDQSSALQKVTRYSDEEIGSVQGLLLTFTELKGPIMQQATQSVLDMSQALGEDTKSASIQLGKALNDPLTGLVALHKVGVDFNETQKKQIKGFVETNQVAKAQGVILAEVNKEFGGSAVAAGKTFAGQMDILKNQIDDVKESMGLAIINGLTPLISKISQFVAHVDWQKVIDRSVAAIKDLTKEIWKFIEPVADFLLHHKDQIEGFFKEFGPKIAVIIPLLGLLTIAIGAVSSPLVVVSLVLAGLWVLWEKHRVMFYALMVVLAPLALAFAALKAQMMFSSTIGILNGAIETLTGTNLVATAATNGLAGAIKGAMLAAAGPLVLVVLGLALIYEAQKAMEKLMGDWDKAIAQQDEALAKEDQSYNKMVKNARAAYAAGKITKDQLDAETSGKPTSLKNTPHYAVGTSWHPGGMALVGEKGPELVNLPRGSQVIPNHQISSSQSVHIGQIVLASSDAVDRFFGKLDQDKISIGKGLTPARGAY